MRLQSRIGRPIGDRGCLSQRNRISCAVVVKSPSSAPSASELDYVSRYTEVVPDQLLGKSSDRFILNPKAATVSYGVLSGVVASESLGLRPLEVRPAHHAAP